MFFWTFINFNFILVFGKQTIEFFYSEKQIESNNVVVFLLNLNLDFNVWDLQILGYSITTHAAKYSYFWNLTWVESKIVSFPIDPIHSSQRTEERRHKISSVRFLVSSIILYLNIENKIQTYFQNFLKTKNEKLVSNSQSNFS